MELLLDQYKDDEILGAINHADSSDIANELRRTVEHVSENIHLRLNGSELEIQLFAIPIIVKFDQDVPGSQVESALSYMEWQGSLAKIFAGDDLEHGRIVVLPTFFTFAALAGIQLSLLRKCAISLAANNGRDFFGSFPFIHKSNTLRRCHVFLRYLVGHRVLSAHKSKDGINTTICTYLQEIIKHLLESHLKLTCSVNAFHTGEFHNPLYTGMWLYQIYRLNKIATAVSSEQCSHGLPKTIITSPVSRANGTLKVGFYDEHQLLGQHAYLLHTRPGEDFDRCVTRLIYRLEAIGMTTMYRRQAAAHIPVTTKIHGVLQFQADTLAIPI